MSLATISPSKSLIFRFLPAVLMMLSIFLFSAGNAFEPPQHLVAFTINKGGHMLGYGILALSYWRMFEFKRNRYWISWLLALLFAMTDEFHQSHVPGRHPRLFDVLVYDNLGALLALWLATNIFSSINPSQRSGLTKKRS